MKNVEICGACDIEPSGRYASVRELTTISLRYLCFSSLPKYESLSLNLSFFSLTGSYREILNEA